MGDDGIDGREPFSAAGGPYGALVLHGLSGTPGSVRGLGMALAGAGLAVEGPLLPGHGTSVEDLAAVGWPEWTAAAEAAYADLAARCARVVVAGLSMGGTLACWLASRHPVAGLVCVNPIVEPPAPSFLEILRDLLAGGNTMLPSIGGDVAKGDEREPAYDRLPVATLLSLMEALGGLEGDLGRITAPLLLFTSRRDHVVPPSSSDHLAERVAGPVERITLEDSYHVATLDHDGPMIERRAAEFAGAVALG
ncbi:MAG TPA: alpha/beta fold hydrolase [Acidimicrobiales bacterium]|nr:alpha/beta fold hydrolase [Acidimicrobiales bacterium]